MCYTSLIVLITLTERLLKSASTNIFLEIKNKTTKTPWNSSTAIKPFTKRVWDWKQALPAGRRAPSIDATPRIRPLGKFWLILGACKGSLGVMEMLSGWNKENLCWQPFTGAQTRAVSTCTIIRNGWKNYVCWFQPCSHFLIKKQTTSLICCCHGDNTTPGLCWSLPQAVNQTEWGCRRWTAHGTNESERGGGGETALSKQQQVSDCGARFSVVRADKEKVVARRKEKKGKMLRLQSNPGILIMWYIPTQTVRNKEGLFTVWHQCDVIMHYKASTVLELLWPQYNDH